MNLRNFPWNLEVRKSQYSGLKLALIIHFNIVLRPFLTGSDESLIESVSFILVIVQFSRVFH